MSEKSKSPEQGTEAEILPSSPEFWREYAKTLCQSPETVRALDGRFWDKAAATYEKEYVKKKVESLAKDGIITIKTRFRTEFLLIDKEAGKAPPH